MSKQLRAQVLLALYEEHGSADKVVEYLMSTAKVGEYVPSARTIQRILKQHYPDYATANKPVKEQEETQDLRPVSGGITQSPDKLRKQLTGKRFVFTSAQNNTDVHDEFLESIKVFCDHRDAELIVSQFAYNKSGFQNDTKESGELWYDPKILPYVNNDSSLVTPGLVFCGELDILPTAVMPMSGLENYTQENSGIVPHTKVQMQSLPRMQGEPERFMYTTGAVTKRNYIPRKAGQKAAFHHVFGALYVEIDEQGDWFARQLVADESGVFHDLTERFSPEGVTTEDVLAVTWGDIHLEKIDPEVFNSVWSSDTGMLKVLNPTFQFIHDLTDFRARNHHNIKDPMFLAEMHHRGQGNVEKDLLRCSSFLSYITRFGNKAIVVESNHDQALVKWLKEADIRQDPENAEFYHRANMVMHQHIRENKHLNVFEYFVKPKDSSDVQFLNEDDSFVVAGIENGMHGHRGPNGARGNPRGFRSIGRKVNTAHSHSAQIIDGVYVAGVSGLMDMGYNKGPSSWSHSHILTYSNGKRAITTMKKGKWKA